MEEEIEASVGREAARLDPVCIDNQRNHFLNADPTLFHQASHRVLLIITGGIAAYKELDLIRRLRERGASVRVVA